MPPKVARKRRSAPEDADGPETPTAGPSQRRRHTRSPSAASDASSPESLDLNTQETSNIDQMAKNLVRYALACEYSRQPVRRADLTAKVLAPGSRAFKAVFAEAQLQLQDVFGMELVELPQREKVTLQQRRAAAQRGGGADKASQQSASSKSWVLRTRLPERYRVVVPPSKIPTVETESTYVGLYSFVVALIYLRGGTISETQLEKHLRRCNADETTPLDRTEKLLARMQKEGYIVRIREVIGDEPSVEYYVGPRGKVEIGEAGVAGLVRAVYGEMDEKLANKLSRTLKLQAKQDGQQPKTNGQTTRPGRKKRAPTEPEDDDDESESEDEDD